MCKSVGTLLRKIGKNKQGIQKRSVTTKKQIMREIRADTQLDVLTWKQQTEKQRHQKLPLISGSQIQEPSQETREKLESWYP